MSHLVQHMRDGIQQRRGGREVLLVSTFGPLAAIDPFLKKLKMTKHFVSALSGEETQCRNLNKQTSTCRVLV